MASFVLLGKFKVLEDAELMQNHAKSFESDRPYSFRLFSFFDDSFDELFDSLSDHLMRFDDDFSRIDLLSNILFFLDKYGRSIQL